MGSQLYACSLKFTDAAVIWAKPPRDLGFVGGKRERERERGWVGGGEGREREREREIKREREGEGRR